MARLDRLGSAKAIAQVGAVIGRGFSHALVAAVVHKSQRELETELEQLIAAGLLFRQGAPPHATYLFKHALVQDAAYGTLLRSSRRQLHGRIADVLEKEFPEIVEVQPELLAKHCAEAGLNEQAIRYWRRAGEKAVRRASNREAIGHFSQALTLNEKQPPDVGRSLTELAILSQLGPALMSVHGWSAPQVGIAFERAEHLARELESSIDLAPPLAGLWLFRTARGQFSRAEEITKELFNVAQTLHDPDSCSKHTTALGQFTGFVGRSQRRRITRTPEWPYMTRFDMRDIASCILDTIRLSALCRLCRFCNGF
jgi:predicted ATPase